MTQQFGLEKALSLSSPGVDGKEEEDIEGDEPLNAEQSTRCRGITARINDLASDRPDVQYSVKEVCRDMSSPSTGSWRRLERIGGILWADRDSCGSARCKIPSTASTRSRTPLGRAADTHARARQEEQSSSGHI